MKTNLRPCFLAAFLLAACAGARAEPGAAAEVRPERRVTQYGITWTFADEAPVGRFVNGDFYVVGPVTVVEIHPRPLVGDEVPEAEIGPRERDRTRARPFVRNGSMKNPPPRQEVAFDSGIRNYFNPKLLAAPPIRLEPGDCLVSSVSLKAGEEAQFPYHGASGSREHRDNSPVRTAAVLTCVKEPLPPDAFRPSYGDREQRIYLARNLRRDRLPRLMPPGRVPDVETWIRVFQRPWINPCFFGFEQPTENMPQYGEWVGQAQSMAGLLLVLDLNPKFKERLLVNMVQVGIDYWGLVRGGHPGWQGWGGHGSGRKFPIVLAGVLLGDEAMASPTRSFPKVEFGEDNQTMAGEGWTGARALFAGHSGIQSATGKAERPKWGPYEHLHPSKWMPSNAQSESYRRANTSAAWVGQALALRLLKAEDAWAHDAFFAYVDRWMTEPGDDGYRREIMKYHPDMKLTDEARFSHQGRARESFVQSMWEMYGARPAVPAAKPPEDAP